MNPRALIVGAGVAGLIAARTLRKEGFDVTLVEREQHIGGRLLTYEPAPGLRFDLGPQYLRGGRWNRLGIPDPGDSATPGIEQLIRESGRSHVTHTTLLGWIGQPPLQPMDDMALPEDVAALAAVSVRGGMARLADILCPPPPHQPDGIDFRNQTQVTRIEQRDRCWRVETTSTLDGSTDLIAADAILLTPPLPIALELLHASELTIPYELRNALRTVNYAACIALSAGFSGPSLLGEMGGIRFDDPPVEWITENRTRAVSAVGAALTALSTAAWAADHFDDPDEAIIGPLLSVLQNWAEGEPHSVRFQRWKYAQATTPLALPCLVACQEPPLVFAGDGFAGNGTPGIEAACTSGQVAARRIVQLVRRTGRFAVQRRVRRFTLEVGVTTADEAFRAQSMGADRLELCAGLEVGGLTPSPGTFLEVREAVRIPVHVLLRPRAGGFTYNNEQFATMKRDAKWFLRHGADGIVFGILKYRRGTTSIAHEPCRELIALAGARDAVFHRAFDFLPEPLLALEELADLGFQRVQSSGGYSTAEGGIGRLAAWVAHAGWQIEIMPAGGITPSTVSHLLKETQAHSVHGSFREEVADPSLSTNPGLVGAMGGSSSEGNWRTTSASMVRAMRSALDHLADDQDGLEEDDEP